MSQSRVGMGQPCASYVRSVLFAFHIKKRNTIYKTEHGHWSRNGAGMGPEWVGMGCVFHLFLNQNHKSKVGMGSADALMLMT